MTSKALGSAPIDTKMVRIDQARATTIATRGAIAATICLLICASSQAIIIPGRTTQITGGCKMRKDFQVSARKDFQVSAMTATTV